MIKNDIANMSLKRKIALTIVGVLYILAILGNARHGFAEMAGVTLAFLTLSIIIYIWIK